jgi:hypothetical protein
LDPGGVAASGSGARPSECVGKKAGGSSGHGPLGAVLVLAGWVSLVWKLGLQYQPRNVILAFMGCGAIVDALCFFVTILAHVRNLSPENMADNPTSSVVTITHQNTPQSS